MSKAVKGSRKHGRNKIGCQAYRSNGTREKNKKARLLKHVCKHPNDNSAWAWLQTKNVTPESMELAA